MWGRGLKQLQREQNAWNLEVAPHVGAWIETPSDGDMTHSVTSPPMWGRGLKLNHLQKDYEDRHVAPHVGAWIET